MRYVIALSVSDHDIEVLCSLIDQRRAGLFVGLHEGGSSEIAHPGELELRAGGTLSADAVGRLLEIGRQAVDKRRQTNTLCARAGTGSTRGRNSIGPIT
jgi:hypothetical protein